MHDFLERSGVERGDHGRHGFLQAGDCLLQRGGGIAQSVGRLSSHHLFRFGREFAFGRPDGLVALFDRGGQSVDFASRRFVRLFEAFGIRSTVEQRGGQLVFEIVGPQASSPECLADLRKILAAGVEGFFEIGDGVALNTFNIQFSMMM